MEQQLLFLKLWADMIKLNRIGNKLSLVGAVVVLLSIAIVANQMVAESSINAANRLADAQQGIVVHTVATEIALRKMQIGVRDARLGRTHSGLEKTASALRDAIIDEQREIDAAIALVTESAKKERLQKIKSVIATYTVGAEDLVRAQASLLRATEKRSGFASEWTKALEAQLVATALAGLPNRQEIESLLYQMDTRINAVRAAMWRFGVTG